MPNFLMDDYKITKGVQLPPIGTFRKKIIDLFKKKHFHIILLGFSFNKCDLFH